MKREYSDIGGIQQQAADIIRQAYDKGYKAGYVDGKDEAYKNPVPTQDAYNNGLRDAWECARRILTITENGTLFTDQLKEIFGGIHFCFVNEIFENYSASEVIAKIKEYKEKQKQTEKSCENCRYEDKTLGCQKHIECQRENMKYYEPKQTDDEIKVGDEIKNKWGTNGVVVEIAPQHNGAIVYSVLWYNAERKCLEKDDWDSYNVWKKTGRHFDAIEKY